MQVMIDQHRKEIQSIIEGMPSGSEMTLAEIFKRYKDYGYPPFLLHEEVQKILQLNIRRFRYFRRENLLGSIIARVEEYV